MFGFLLQLLEFDVLCHCFLVVGYNGYEQMVEFGDDENEKHGQKYVEQ